MAVRRLPHLSVASHHAVGKLIGCLHVFHGHGVMAGHPDGHRRLPKLLIELRRAVFSRVLSRQDLHILHGEIKVLKPVVKYRRLQSCRPGVAGIHVTGDISPRLPDGALCVCHHALPVEVGRDVGQLHADLRVLFESKHFPQGLLCFLREVPPHVEGGNPVIFLYHPAEGQFLFIAGSRVILQAEGDAHCPLFQRFFKETAHLLYLLPGCFVIGPEAHKTSQRAVSHEGSAVYGKPGICHSFIVFRDIRRGHAAVSRHDGGHAGFQRRLCHLGRQKRVGEVRIIILMGMDINKSRRQHSASGVDHLLRFLFFGSDICDLFVPDCHSADPVRPGGGIHNSCIIYAEFVHRASPFPIFFRYW